MKPIAVLFDMDGVIFDSEKLSYSLTKEILSEFGHSLTFELYSKTIGVSERECATLFSNAFSPVDGQFDVLNKLYSRYKQALCEGKLEIKLGLIELLNYLDIHGIKKAVASSNVEEIVRCSLDNAGIRSRFDTIVHAGDVKNAKPSPEIYQEAMRRLGVTPKDCFALEDSPSGVQSAYSAGVPVILIPDMLPPTVATQALCVLECENLFDVITYLNKI